MITFFPSSLSAWLSSNSIKRQSKLGFVEYSYFLISPSSHVAWIIPLTFHLVPPPFAMMLPGAVRNAADLFRRFFFFPPFFLEPLLAGFSTCAASTVHRFLLARPQLLRSHFFRSRVPRSGLPGLGRNIFLSSLVCRALSRLRLQVRWPQQVFFICHYRLWSQHGKGNKCCASGTPGFHHYDSFAIGISALLRCIMNPTTCHIH